MCGTAETCNENTVAPTCDADNNRCICGEVGEATSGCTVSGETCEGGTCMCGSYTSCNGNIAAPTCDVANNQCICGTVGIATSGCIVTGDTCVAGTCIGKTETFT